MTKKDLTELQAVIPLYTMCYCMSELIDEVKYDLPENMADSIETFVNSLRGIMSEMDAYQEKSRSVFMAACEDSNTEESE